MLNHLSIRAKVILLSGLCLLAVVGLVLGMNLYQSRENNHVVGDASSQMLTQSVKNLLQAISAEKALSIQKSFGENVLMLSALNDQVKDLRRMGQKRSMSQGAATFWQPSGKAPESHGTGAAALCGERRIRLRGLATQRLTRTTRPVTRPNWQRGWGREHHHVDYPQQQGRSRPAKLMG